MHNGCYSGWFIAVPLIRFEKFAKILFLAAILKIFGGLLVFQKKKKINCSSSGLPQDVMMGVSLPYVEYFLRKMGTYTH